MITVATVVIVGIIALGVGVIAGCVITALCAMAAKGDEQMEQAGK